jgi:ferredoxin
MAAAVPRGNTSHREIRVDRTLCMGSGQCCWYAPNTFDQDDETIAIVIDPQGDPEEAVNTAVDSCPTRAISIVADADGTADTRQE